MGKTFGEFVALAVGHELYHHRERLGEISVHQRSPRARICRRRFCPRAVGAFDVNVLLAGIDGGQSSTVAVIGDQAGAYFRLRHRRTGRRDRCRQRLDPFARCIARRAGGCAAPRAPSRREHASPQSSPGSAATTASVYGRAPELPSARVRLMHDTPIAHAGALGGRAGVVVIAGTGSVVYGRNEDGLVVHARRLGLSLRRRGKRVAHCERRAAKLMRAHDEGDASLEAETRAACDFFGTRSLRRLAHAFYKGEVTRDRLASFAPTALRFDVLRTLADRGADRLAVLIRRAIAAGSPARVALVGGVFADASVSQSRARRYLAGYSGCRDRRSAIRTRLRSAPPRLSRARSARDGAAAMSLLDSLRRRLDRFGSSMARLGARRSPHHRGDGPGGRRGRRGGRSHRGHRPSARRSRAAFPSDRRPD